MSPRLVMVCRVVVMAWLAGLAPIASGRTRPVEVPREAYVVLNEGSFWRWHLTTRKPVVPAVAFKDATGPKALPGLYVDTQPPPPGWTKADFDDGLWPRTAGADFAHLVFSRLDASVVCLRGKFHCKDLRRETWKPDLYVSARFRGGIIVYLNGREVARAGLPAGQLEPTTAADPYPDDLSLDENGRPYVFPESSKARERVAAGDKDLARRLEGRDRALEPVKIGFELLRYGTNMVAIELHRSDYHPAALTWSTTNGFGEWVPCQLSQFRLAVTGEAITPNIARPRRVQIWKDDGTGQVWTKATQVWNADRNDRISTLDYGDPNEPLRPIRLVGARNGVFSGQIVVSSDQVIRKLEATAGDLRHADGKGLIPAASVRVRYPRPDGSAYSIPTWFEGIDDSAPAQVKLVAGGAVQPVFVTVQVPKSAAAGDYAGELRVSTDELEPVSVPVQLYVSDWTLPEPHAYRAFRAIYQSPESVAAQYKVPLWSGEHWKLIEKSFDVLAYVGAGLVQIPLVNRSTLGNGEGWVWWIRKADGTYDYDFTVFDRYTALVKKYLVDPQFVCLHVWRSPVYGEAEAMKKEHHVTMLDPATGTRSPLRVPEYGTKESLAFWKPVVLALRDRLAKLGLEKSLCFGVLIESYLQPSLKEFSEIIPEAGWIKGCHGPTTASRPIAMPGGSRLVLQEHAYPVGGADPLKNVPSIWERDRIGVHFYRGQAETRELQDWRILAEWNLYHGSRGMGRVGLDYWPVLSGRSIYNRYPESSSAQRGLYTFHLAWPGPDGARPTLRLEALREGLQECEALIFIAEAQALHADKLGPELAEKCRQLIMARVEYTPNRVHQPWGPLFTHVNHYGWQKLNRELFDTAAEVAAKLGRTDDPAQKQ